jgi:REP element-mobilizing transposase RayT
MVKKELFPEEYYHIYNRGNGKNKIFLNQQDYYHLIKLLFVYNSEINFKFRDAIVSQKIDAWDFDRGRSLVDICSWVLMPNHFHLLIISHRSDLWNNGRNPISEYIRKVFTSYSMYFNKKYHRSGSLFEGKFKSKLIKEENYFNYLFAYIHLNPVKLIQKDWKENGINDKNEAIKFLKEYKYSSFPDLLKKQRKENKLVNINSLPIHIREAKSDDIFNWFINSKEN